MNKMNIGKTKDIQAEVFPTYETTEKERDPKLLTIIFENHCNLSQRNLIRLNFPNYVFQKSFNDKEVWEIFISLIRYGAVD